MGSPVLQAVTVEVKGSCAPIEPGNRSALAQFMRQPASALRADPAGADAPSRPHPRAHAPRQNTGQITDDPAAGNMRRALDRPLTQQPADSRRVNARRFQELLAQSSAKLGQPLVQGAKVTAQIVRHGRGEKLIVFKFRRRKRYKRKNGHRQNFTEVKITGISA